MFPTFPSSLAMNESTRPDDLEPEFQIPDATAADVETNEGDVALVMAESAYLVVDTSEGPVDLPEPVGVAPSVPDVEAMADLFQAIGQLGGKVDRLQVAFDRELRAESSREKVVDRLHAELQEYKNDLLLKITRPIFIDLIQLHDDMGKLASSLEDDPAKGILQDVQQGIEDVLYRQGVEPFQVDEETFDPRRQRAISTVATDDPEQNKRISSRIRPGFSSGEKVIRPELVSVFSFKRSDAGPS